MKRLMIAVFVGCCWLGVATFGQAPSTPPASTDAPGCCGQAGACKCGQCAQRGQAKGRMMGMGRGRGQSQMKAMRGGMGRGARACPRMQQSNLPNETPKSDGK